ncbi:MAG: DNA-directed RNA polymerase subunit delta [Roseburia sp.]|nr:DNA-directed RNA polymerase subunit delta [Anaeroplasma bactoclasticum]MCM1195729.1 DNA-directed RNA polymerase subunit delta [Roseburia sp.]MCM1556079.1 DNA-directed RNA polymerase subunit delta [Anaeroplasma bactoclasticum]
MENVSQMSLLEVAIYLMEQKKVQQNIRALIREVLEIKGLDDADGKLATQLYIDITTSSKFVYMGNEEWDLKCRQSLDEYDKDGSAFNVKGAELDDEPLDEDEDLDEESLDEDEDEYEEDEDEDEYEREDEYDEDEESEYEDEYDEDEDAIIDGELTERYSEDDFNEDKYNDLMDDYEDMYEE